MLSFENLIFNIFEFITALVETPRFKKTIKEYLEDIMFYTMLYMQITDEQVQILLLVIFVTLIFQAALPNFDFADGLCRRHVRNLQIIENNN